LDSLNTDYVFVSLVSRLRGGQSGACGSRSHGAIGSQVYRRDCYYGCLIRDFTPPLPKTMNDWLHVGFVEFLMQQFISVWLIFLL
jgi:hypothetical protein